MIRIIKWLSIFFVWAILCGPSASAQSNYTAASCSQSDVNSLINGPKHTAIPGDVIDIPAGSCTWTSGIQISVNGISVIGSGESTLTITDAISDGQTALFAFSSTYGASGCNTTTTLCARLSGITFSESAGITNGYSPVTFAGVCTSTWCPNIRLDHVTFDHSFVGTGQMSQVVRTNNVFGVIDHNTVNTNGVGFVNANNSAWGGIGTAGDASWAAADSFGTAQQIYMEANSLGPGVGATDCDNPPYYPGGQSAGGCRVAVRFNTFTSPPAGGGVFYNHGTETTGRARGGRQTEAYQNTILENATGPDAFVYMRSGVALVWGNTITLSGQGANAILKLSDYRTFSYWAPWGVCDGTGGYDHNDGTVYASGTFNGLSGTTVLTDTTKSWTSNQWVVSGAPYSVHNLTQGWGFEIGSNTANTATSLINSVNNVTNSLNWPNVLGLWNAGDSYEILRASVCIDQPSRGAGTYISGGTPSPTGWVNEVLDPAYEWMDTVFGATYFGSPIVPNTRRLIANRDYYSESLNQPAQTSQTTPFNGTSGTGHGTLANRPATCVPGVAYWATDQGNWNQSGSGGQGQLYVCSALKTWSVYYTPYTYPHPLSLSSGVTQGTATINPPTNLAATVQ